MLSHACGVSVDVIVTCERFERVRADWERLYERDPEAQLFLSWQWLSDLYARRAEEPRIVACRADGGDYLAFLPLRREVRVDEGVRGFRTTYRMAGNHWADYTGLLCAPEDERVAIAALGEHLAGLSWSRLHLDSLALSERRLALLLGAFDPARHRIRERERRDTAGLSDLLRSPRITLPETFERYLGLCLSANARQRVRRFGRRLDADPTLRVDVSEAATRENDLQSFRRLWKRRWTHDKGAAEAARLARRYALILEQGLEAGQMRLWAMRQGQRPVAFNACYVDPVKRAVLFFVGARELSFEVVPAGLLLHVRAIEWAIGQGHRHYDLLGGDEPYKYSLGARDVRLRSLSIERLADDGPAALDDDALDDALAALHRSRDDMARDDVEALYRALRSRWPDEPVVRERHEDWSSRSASRRRGARSGPDGEPRR